MAEKRYGNQFPTTELKLPFEKSNYEQAIEIYEKSGKTALPWQKNLLKNWLAVNADGLWTHTKIGLAVPRRNGKNEALVMREMYGLLNGEKMLHTAHLGNTSHSAFERLCQELTDAGVDYTSIKARGQELIRLDEYYGSGSIHFRTRTKTGALGEGFDTLIIDEAQEYTTDQESALKYVVSAGGGKNKEPNPQTIMVGTPPTPVSSGTVFLNFRKSTRDGKARNAYWAEWSIESQSDIEDKELWYLTNPSLGYILSERAIEDELSGEDDVDFNIQRLGLWLKYNQKSAIAKEDWEKLIIINPDITDLFVGKVFVGVKYTPNGNTGLSVAVKLKTGEIFIESIDTRPTRAGNDWIIELLKNIDWQEIAIDGASGQQVLEKEIRENKLKGKITQVKVKEYVSASSQFEQAIYQQTLRHSSQPSLDIVAINSDKRMIGSSGGFGYTTNLADHDSANLESVVLAHWLAVNVKPIGGQKIYY